MMRFFTARRMILGLALFGLLPLATGCEGTAPAPESASEQDKAQTKSMMEAMQKAHGPGGVASGKKPTK